MSDCEGVHSSKPPPRDAYMLNRNWQASNRLTTQHYILASRNGWLVHPKIATDLKSYAESLDRPLRIADVAAGNCIWSIDVLNEFPDAEVTAFDLSTDQFPVDWSFPSNVKTEQYNVFEPPAEKYQGYFDLVHLRLIVAAIQDGGRDLVVRNLVAMTKPGGWVQWHETESPGSVPINPETLERMPELPWPRFMQIVDEETRIFKSMDFTADLQAVLRDVGGLVNTENFRAPLKKGLLRRETDVTFWLYEEFRTGPLKAKLTEEQDQEYIQSMADQAELMRKEKLAWSHFFIVAIGKKP